MLRVLDIFLTVPQKIKTKILSLLNCKSACSLGFHPISLIVLSHLLCCILFLLLPLNYEWHLKVQTLGFCSLFCLSQWMHCYVGDSIIRSWAHVLTWDSTFQVQQLHEPFSLGWPWSSCVPSHYLSAQSSCHSLTYSFPSEATHSFQVLSLKILDESQWASMHHAHIHSIYHAVGPIGRAQ